MSQTKHTPTPWSWTIAGTSKTIVIKSSGFALLRMYAGLNGEADAAFIVEAVNSHASLVEENRRLLAIEKAAQRLAYVVRKSVNAGPVSNDPTAEGQAWRALRLALGESYDEKGALT